MLTYQIQSVPSVGGGQDLVILQLEQPYDIAAHLRFVDVAVYGAQGAESFQLVCYLTGADIAGVPDFVAFFKVLKDAFVQVGVGVGEEADSFHKWFGIRDFGGLQQGRIPNCEPPNLH